MQRYILRRLLQAILSAIAISIIVFTLSRLSGDPVELMLSDYAGPEDFARMSKLMGTDKPLPVQYGLFLGRMVKGDLGTSIVYSRSVSTLIAERFPATLQLSGFAIVVSILISVPIGVYSATRRGGIFDLLARLYAVLGQSLPSFWLGLMLMLIFAVILDWLPTSGQGGFDHIILPAFTLGWYQSAGIMRMTRSSMLDVLDTEYVKLARIKGVSRLKVVWKHALKNALVPIITFAGLRFVALIVGTVVVETIFAWPGVGRLVIDAIARRDFPVVQAAVLLFGMIYISANLLIDILYAYINPKIRFG